MKLVPIVAAIASAAVAFPARSKPPAVQPSVENLYWMVDCLLQHDARDLNRVLSTVPGAQYSGAPWLFAAISPCLVAERPIVTPTFFARGALAERLLYRDFASVGAEPRHRPVPLFAPVGQDYLGSADEQSRRLLAALDMASCVTRREPERVYAFFRTARASPSERAAMVELTPAISACLVEGQTFDMPPPLFRAFLAEGAYRVAAGQPNVYEEAQ